MILTAYIIYGISKYLELGVNLLNDLRFWATAMLTTIGGSIIVVILIQIIFHIILAVGNEVSKEIAKAAKHGGKKEIYEEVEIEEFEDEMDKLISLKSTRNSFIVCGVGFVISLISLCLKMPPAVMLNIVFISFNLGSLLESFSQLYFYRKGVTNG